MLQIIKKHDVDSAVKILFEHAGPVFQEQVIKWGAVHADQRRCAEACLLHSFYETNSWTRPCIAALTWACLCILPTRQSRHIRRQRLRQSWHSTQLTSLAQWSASWGLC